MILHITNDFNLTKVHKELYANLDDLGVKQKIFIPLRNTNQIGNNHFNFKHCGSEYIYSKKINIIHRVFFPYKISYLFNSLLKKINLEEIKLSHATTLFSDGAIAYKLYKKYNIPYVVAVRNTDINFYFNKRKELISLGIKILENASKIIFISQANMDSFYEKSFVKKIRKKIDHKVIVINNGIDQYWLNNRNKYSKVDDNYNFLFIGRFDHNKNVENLIASLDTFRIKSNLPINLHLVGGTGVNHEKVINDIKDKNWIKYHGEIYDKSKLKKIFSMVNYFSMISHHETFGLVFIEALSQGKSLLYTKGQGVDRIFDFKIGEKVNSKDVDNIVNQLEVLISNKYYEINDIDFSKFSWPCIALEYKHIYTEILK